MVEKRSKLGHEAEVMYRGEEIAKRGIKVI